MPYKDYSDKLAYQRKYNATPEAKKRRAEQNRARRKMMQQGKVRKGDGKDVAHVKPVSKGGTWKDGLRVESPSKNRGFKRDSKGRPVWNKKSR